MIAIAATLVAGCSWGEDEQTTRNAIVPPIVAVDRTLPASAFGPVIEKPFGSACVEISPSGTSRPCSKQRERAISTDERRGLPRRGASVRLVAELALARPKSLAQKATFVVFPSRGLGTCFAAVFEPELANLECAGGGRCKAVCLSWMTDGDYLLVFGTVTNEADALRLSFRNGSTRLYALTGPPARRAGPRVFMADLGRGPAPERMEALDGEDVIASRRWNSPF